MKASRLFFALPILATAALAAQACSSSSNNGGGGGATGSCLALQSCCSALTGSFATQYGAQCTAAVTAGNQSTCASDLTTFEGANACTATGSSGTGTGVGGTGSGTGGSGTGTGTGGSGTGSGTGGGTQGACSAPSTTLPAGFAGPTGIVGSGCSAAQTTALGGCDVATTDAGQNACDTTFTTGAPDGSVNSCGSCYFTQILPVGAQPTQWGYDFLIVFEPTVGDTNQNDWGALNLGPNLGACVAGADKSATGQACGKALMTLNACEFAVCLPVCPVSGINSNNPSTTDIDAFFSCNQAADMGACATYVTALQTACATEVNDAGTGVYDKCLALTDQNIGLDGSPAATAASNSAAIGLVCGGADAGF